MPFKANVGLLTTATCSPYRRIPKTNFESGQPTDNATPLVTCLNAFRTVPPAVCIRRWRAEY